MSGLEALWAVMGTEPVFWIVMALGAVGVTALAYLTTGAHEYPPRNEPERLTPEQQRQLASFPVQRIAHADQLQQQRNKGEAR